jgi:hypothetical protein
LELSGPEAFLSLLSKAAEKDIKAISEVVSGSFGDVPATYRVMLREAGMQAVRGASAPQLQSFARTMLGDGCARKGQVAGGSGEALAPKKDEDPAAAALLSKFYTDVEAADAAARAKLRVALDACPAAAHAAADCPLLREAVAASLSSAYSVSFRHNGWAKGSPEAEALATSPCPLLGSAGDPKADFAAKSEALIASATKSTKDATQTIFDMWFPGTGTLLKLSKAGASDVIKLIPAGTGGSIASTWSMATKSYIGLGFAAAGITMSLAKNNFEFRQKKDALYTTR